MIKRNKNSLSCTIFRQLKLSSFHSFIRQTFVFQTKVASLRTVIQREAIITKLHTRD
jgi:hypothetical protein